MATGLKLNRYSCTLKRDKVQFPCPRCGVYLLSKDYEGHCTKKHNINARLCCVWCHDDKPRVTFSRKKDPNIKSKNDTADHLLECWRKFMNRLADPAPKEDVPPPDRCVFFDFTPTCEKENFFGRLRISCDEAYETVSPIDLEPPPVPFEDHTLNLAASCVSRYLKGGEVWYHVMVRAVAFDSFLEAMRGDSGVTCTLPFSCWCDGGTYPEDYYRYHRHMIVVSKSAKYFRNKVWKKVKPEDSPYKGFKCKAKKPIKSRLHLVNALGYLSQRRSKCNFTFSENEEIDGNLNHFYILETLPKEYRLVLVTLWDGGLMELISQKYGRMDPNLLLRVPMEFVDTKWRIKVRNLPGIVLNRVLPISREFRSSEQPTDYYLHLIDGKKLYFKPGRQTKKDFKLFYYVIADEWWVPKRMQQECFKCAKPFMARCEQSEKENGTLKRKLETTEKEKGEMNKRHKKEMDEMAKCHERAMGGLKKKLEVVKKENGTLREKNESLEKEVKELWKKVDRLKDKENDRLNAENADLKAEIMRLRRENTQLKEHLAKYIKCDLKESSMET